MSHAACSASWQGIEATGMAKGLTRVESSRFDGITKDLARIRSRRHVLRTLAAGTGIGVLLRLRGSGEALAAAGIKKEHCGHDGDPCLSNDECCGRRECFGIGFCAKPPRKIKPA
jgi:hypothetical protein